MLTSMPVSGREKKKWYRLDNAAKIYPAIQNARWNSIFRVALTMKQPVDPDLLQKALERVVPRFENMRFRLHRGLFWYYFEINQKTPLVEKDVQNPCRRLNFKKNGGFMFRVRYHHQRIAVEVFHALADGTGGMQFLKTLTAEYLRLMGEKVSCTQGVLDINEPTHPEEMEDGYRRFFDPKAVFSRFEKRAWHIKGMPDEKDAVNIISGCMPVDKVLDLAHGLHVSVTELLVSVYLYSIQNYQRGVDPKTRKPIKVSVPVNMRNFYPSRTLRNFALFVNVGIEPGLGAYEFEEILHYVYHTLRSGFHRKYLSGLMAANVTSESSMFLRLVPLFFKNIGLLIGYRILGEGQYTTTLSNLGVVKLPEEMQPFVEKAELILGPPRSKGISCAAASCGNTLTINFTRNIVQPDIEKEFFRFFVKQGIPVKVESNY